MGLLDWIRSLIERRPRAGDTLDHPNEIAGMPETAERIPMPPARTEAFWEIVDISASAGDNEVRIEALRRELEKLDRDALVAFRADYDRALEGANSWDIWAAAYILNGGCSDDGFDYFRDWLISCGKSVFEEALNDPESLVEIAQPGECELEEYRYVVHDVFEEKFDEDVPLFDLPENHGPKGEPFDERSVEDRFPALAAWVAANS